jgi:hypothetical protein
MKTSLRVEELEDRLVPSASATPDYVLARTSIGIDSGSTPQQSGGFTPQQLRQAYGFDQIWFNNGTIRGDGSGQTIAIVDAYDNPNIASDLHVFDQTFGIPDPPSFLKVNQTGGVAYPSADPGWGLEEALDVEWAHAIAPGATIMLVEANSASDTDLLAAVDYARNAPGVVAVSMSWGGSEFSGQVADDAHFQTPAGHGGVTFVASSGDSGAYYGVIWPSSSANVLSVGGTSLLLDSSGNWSNEIGWSGSGGGISTQVSQPGYQRGYVSQSTTFRTNPDVAYDATPGTGVAVYDTQYFSYYGEGPWIEVGGTSAGAPQWTALIAIADQGRALQGLGSLDGPSQLLPRLYHLPGDFHDITTGDNGDSSYAGSRFYPAGPGYDLVTGLGSPKANLLIPDLVSNAPIPTNLNIAALNLTDASSGRAITYGSPGETINFSPSILDWGQLAATNATIQVVSATPGVTVVGTSTLSLGTVNPNQRVQPAGSFHLQLSSGLTDLQQVQLNFIFTYGAGQQTVSQTFDVVKLQAQTEVQVSFTPGSLLADPHRDVVYLIDKGNLKVLAINTDTGQTVAQANLAGSPNNSDPGESAQLASGEMAVSLDGTRLYVALSDAQEIQVFSLPDLAPLATYSYSFHPVSLAYGANDRLYATSTDYWGPIRQIDALTGVVLGQFQQGANYSPYYKDSLLRASPDGNTLYATERYLQTYGGPNYVFQYDISGTGLPAPATRIPYEQLNSLDFAVDQQHQQVYTMNGGDYAVQVTSTVTDDNYSWSFPSSPLSGGPVPYGTSVAYLPGSPAVYAGSGGPYDATISRYLVDGTFVGSYALQPNTGWTLPGGSLKITPNGSLMYILTQFTGNATTPYLYRIGIIGSSTLNISENLPSVASAASATPNPVTGTTSTLSVLGADAGGEASLRYTWSVNGPGGVTFSANGSNAAKNTVATFSQAGTYTFKVTITNASGLTATSSTTVTVNQTLTSIAVSPASATVNDGATQQFTATAFDQFGNALISAPSFAWSVGGAGAINNTGLYTAPATGSGTDTVQASSGGVNGYASVTFNSAVSSSASFVTNDGTTQGSWGSAYGADGFAISQGTASLPSYATVNVIGNYNYVWNGSTSDPRALVNPGASGRLAACWYTPSGSAGSSFTIDVNLTDGQAHQVALYALDWDSYGPRQERIDVLDAATGTVLDSRTVTGFSGGQYLVWNVAGHVQFQVTNLVNGSNAVISGLFFGGAPAVGSTAAFVGNDANTQGTWQSTYGADGYDISQGNVTLPSYASVNVTGNYNYVWNGSTSDPRALVNPGASGRLAACWYTPSGSAGSSFTIDVNLTDGQAHPVALYALDWDNYGPRQERIDVLDAATGTVLDSRTLTNFSGGQYEVWNVSGHVQFRVTNLVNGSNAVISGLFFGPGAAAGPIVVHLSEDAWQGDAQYIISVDGQQVGGIRTETASHAQGQSEAVTLPGLYAAGSHTVTITFINDAYGGTPSTDRNLYVDGIDFMGVSYFGAALYSNGSWTVQIG